MGLIDSKVKTEITWNPRSYNSLMKRLNTNLNKSLRFYKTNLKESIKTWSSIPYSGNIRQWIFELSSSPGDPPHRATGNYYNSIKTELDQKVVNQMKSGGKNGKPQFIGTELSGNINTDVEYGPTLEFGGFNKSNAVKKHTNIKLINKFNEKFIDARPHWLPMFEKTKNQMINIIKGL